MIFNNRVIGFVAIIGAVAIFVVTLGFRQLPSQTLGPGFFPRAISIGIALVGIGIAIPKPRRRAISVVEWLPTWSALIPAGTIISIVLWVILQPTLGFLIPTALVIAALTWGTGGKPGVALLLGAGMSILFYIVFAILLGVPLSRGPVETLLYPLASFIS